MYLSELHFLQLELGCKNRGTDVLSAFGKIVLKNIIKWFAASTHISKKAVPIDISIEYQIKIYFRLSATKMGSILFCNLTPPSIFYAPSYKLYFVI